MSLSNSLQLRIAGVPEHFNLPWHLAIESGRASSAGFSIDWRDYSTGTGAMLADLVDGERDLALLLTEGAALGLARGLPIVPLSLYTTTPLIWGVHVAPEGPLRSFDDLQSARFAISRFGSGSHLMSLAMAIERGWPVDGLEFVVVDNMPGAALAFGEGRADVFLWEHFTTQPEVDAGVFRRIGDFVSPWPAWTICVRESVWQAHQVELERLVGLVAAEAAQLTASDEAAALIASRYGLEQAAVVEWLGRTEWVAGITDPTAALATAHRMLEAADAI